MSQKKRRRRKVRVDRLRTLDLTRDEIFQAVLSDICNGHAEIAPNFESEITRRIQLSSFVDPNKFSLKEAEDVVKTHDVLSHLTIIKLLFEVPGESDALRRVQSAILEFLSRHTFALMDVYYGEHWRQRQMLCYWASRRLGLIMSLAARRFGWYWDEQYRFEKNTNVIQRAGRYKNKNFRPYKLEPTLPLALSTIWTGDQAITAGRKGSKLSLQMDLARLNVLRELVRRGVYGDHLGMRKLAVRYPNLLESPWTDFNEHKEDWMDIIPDIFHIPESIVSESLVRRLFREDYEEVNDRLVKKLYELCNKLELKTRKKWWCIDYINHRFHTVAYYVVLPDESEIVQSRFYSAKQKSVANAAAARDLVQKLERRVFEKEVCGETKDWLRIVREFCLELELKIEVEYTPKHLKVQRPPFTCRIFVEVEKEGEVLQTYGVGMTKEEASYVAAKHMAAELGLRTEENREWFNPEFFNHRL